VARNAHAAEPLIRSSVTGATGPLKLAPRSAAARRRLSIVPAYH
jgi:hypothetical protein